MSLFLLKVLILLTKQFLQKLEPHNDDSIEKTDLLALIAVLLFIFFIWRGLSIASRARVAAIPPPPPTTRPPAESELTETTATPTNTPPTPFTPQASLLSPSNEPQAPQQPHTDDEPAEYDDLQARIEASLLSPPTPPPVHTVKDGQRRLRLLSRQKLVREASTEPVTQDNGATSAAQITSKAPVAPTEAPSDVLDSSMTHLETSPLPEQSPVAGRSDPPAPSPDSSIHTTCQTAESIPSSASTGQRPRYKHGWRKIDPSVQGMNWAAQRRRSYPAPLLPLHQKTIQRIQAGKNGPSTSTEAVSSMVDEHINQTEEYNRPEPTPRGSAPRIQPAMSTSSDETGDSVCYETPSEYTNSLGAAEMDSLASDFAMLLINPGTPETPEVSPAHANSVSLTSPESGHGVGVQSVISSTITAPEQVEEQVPQDDEDDYDSDPDGLYYATPPAPSTVHSQGIMDTGTQDEDMVDTPSTNVATHTQPDTSGPMEGVLNSVPAPQLPPQSTTQLDTSRPMEGVQNSVLERPKPPQSTVNPPSDDSGPMEGIHQSFQVPQHPAQSSVPTQSNEQGDEMDVVQNTIPAPPPPAQAKTTMARNRDIRENFRLTRRAKDDFVSNDSEPKGIVTVEEAIRNAFLNVRSKSTAANSAAAAQGTSPAQTGLAPATSLPTASSTSAPSNIKVTPSASSQGNLQSADVASPSVLKKRSRDAYERPISSQNAQAPRALAPIKRTRPQNGNSEYTDEVALFDEDGVVAVEQTGEAFGPQFCVNSQVRAAGADMSAVMAALGIYASKLDIKVRLERFCTSVDDLMELANLLSYLGETKQNGEKITKQRGPSVFVVKKTAADIPISKLKTLPASFFLAVAGAATSMSQYIMSNMQAGTFNAADSPAVKDAVKTRKPRNLPLFWVNVEVRSKAVPIADNGFDAVQDLATQYWTDPKINPLLMTAQSTGAFSTRVKEIFKKPLVSDMITLAQIRAVHGVRDLVETNALTIIRQSLVPELIERLQAEMYGSSIEELEGQYKIGSDPPNTSRRMTDLWSAVDNCGNPMIPTDRRAFQFPNPIRFR
ncbi:hypothetical protein K490DRAFT_52586 [Saccharata proteae CBS 121410]|uniref:Uncharacterized protein n=1 Tax=Saccharata proteae CBS 121410 TaxID=1314787 RepID=A0A9P4LZQ6_9PEZI|nr:hypothetical protein K490DRAFT_52586 [Saccharata proteae CBS 121410]